MSRTVAPLLSFGASGAIAKTQVYATWKGRPYARRYVVPANPDTAAQQLTRNTFKYLNNLWKYLPSGAIGGWDAYAKTSRFTARNGWLKQNVGPLREETDLANISLSPAANGGIVAAAMDLTAGSEEITVDLTEPTLPTGWAITAAWAVAVANENPQTSAVYEVASGTDAATPFSIVLSGLTAAQEYVVGGWFQYTKPDGSAAYGVALQDTATPTV